MKFLIPIITLTFLISCNGNKENNVVDEIIEAIDSNYCDCDELVFDEPYNHFWLFEKRIGFNGKCESFYPKGQLKEIKFFENGKNHGIFTTYYDNGQIKIQKEFDMNFQVGEQLTYTKSGEVKFHVLYERGKMLEILVNRPELFIDEQ